MRSAASFHMPFDRDRWYLSHQHSSDGRVLVIGHHMRVGSSSRQLNHAARIPRMEAHLLHILPGSPVIRVNAMRAGVLSCSPICSREGASPANSCCQGSVLQPHHQPPASVSCELSLPRPTLAWSCLMLLTRGAYQPGHLAVSRGLLLQGCTALMFR